MRRPLSLMIAASTTLFPAPLLLAEAPLRLPPKTRKADTMLDRPVAELKMDKVPLSDALDFLRDTTSANLHVNWRSLESAGIAKDTPVSINLRNVPLRKALNYVLSGTQATWFIDSGIIEVTTQEIADKHTYTRVYPVDDIIMVVPDFIGPQFSLQQASQSGQGGGGGQSPFQQNNTTNNTPEQARAQKQQRGQDLVDLITQTIRPDVWKSAGGPATIAYYNGSLVVTAPRQVHEMIAGR